MSTDNSKKYNFFLKGNGAKAVLLIHGITGTPSEMRYLGRKLNKAGYTVFCNTLPRHCSTLGELKKVSWQEIVEACAEDLKLLKDECPKVFVGGISMGALVAVHLAYQLPHDVSGIIALAPTIFYDGWALHKGKVLLNLVWPVPFLRNRVNIREGAPYGLKDEVLREHIKRFYQNARADQFDDKVKLFGSPFFPAACLYQHRRFSEIVKKELSLVDKPIIILHAKEDDMVSIKNARYILDHIGSKDKELVVLQNSYHMITIDQEKDKVAEESIKFLNKL